MASWNLHLTGHALEEDLQKVLAKVVTELEDIGHVVEQAVLTTDYGQINLPTAPVPEPETQTVGGEPVLSPDGPVDLHAAATSGVITDEVATNPPAVPADPSVIDRTAPLIPTPIDSPMTPVETPDTSSTPTSTEEPDPVDPTPGAPSTASSSESSTPSDTVTDSPPTL